MRLRTYIHCEPQSLWNSMLRSVWKFRRRSARSNSIIIHPSVEARRFKGNQQSSYSNESLFKLVFPGNEINIQCWCIYDGVCVIVRGHFVDVDFTSNTVRICILQKVAIVCKFSFSVYIARAKLIVKWNVVHRAFNRSQTNKNRRTQKDFSAWTSAHTHNTKIHCTRHRRSVQKPIFAYQPHFGRSIYWLHWNEKSNKKNIQRSVLFRF